MSLEPHDPTVPTTLPRDAEPAVEVAEFYAPPPVAHRNGGAARRDPSFRDRRQLSIVLFLVTSVCVFLVGMIPGGALRGVWLQAVWLFQLGVLRPDWPEMLTNGFVFCGCLMGILLAHEMGHYLQAVRHRVPATWPFFIPFPISPFGTMGAVILQDGRRADRRQMFDIAISGPLAGLVLAIPITWYGVSISAVDVVSPNPTSIHYGNPLLLDWIVGWIHRPMAANEDILLNAPLFAGWVGLFITGLNLLPVGQLDGGHILYMLIGRRAHYVAYGVMGLAIAWMAYSRRFEFALIFVLLMLMGPKHPPTADDRAPLGIGRILLGWLTLAFIIVGFTPTPILM
ncbi:MAG: site-2 protease family protein [Planctomycetaceae bacterium]